MILGALGDAHGRKYIDSIRDMKKSLSGVQLLLLAGDMADSNQMDEFSYAFSKIRENTDAPIVAVFGNDEWEQSRKDYRKEFDATFLDDEASTIPVDGINVKIVGTTGSLDRPTWWQRKHVPNIGIKYRERTQMIDSLLERGDADLLILLMHYAPTYLTLPGERQKAFPEMGSRSFEPILLRRCPDLAIHSHAHEGKRFGVLQHSQRSLEDYDCSPKGIPIYNVSLPLTGTVVRWEIEHGDKGAQVRLLE